MKYLVFIKRSWFVKWINTFIKIFIGYLDVMSSEKKVYQEICFQLKYMRFRFVLKTVLIVLLCLFTKL